MNVLEQFLSDMKKVVPEPLWNVLVFFIALGVVIWTIIRAFVFVGPGQVGIRKRFGKPVLVYKTDPITGRKYTKAEIPGLKAHDLKLIQSHRPARYGRPEQMLPGWNWLVPLMHSVEIVQISINNIALAMQRIVEELTYVAYDMTSITINIRVADAYLWMITSQDAEAQVKAISDTALAWILDEFTTEQIRKNDPAIHIKFRSETDEAFRRIGAELDELLLGAKPLNIEASWDAQSRIKVADAIIKAAEIGGRFNAGASIADS